MIQKRLVDLHALLAQLHNLFIDLYLNRLHKFLLTLKRTATLCRPSELKSSSQP